MIALAHEAPALVAGYDPHRDASNCWYDGDAAQHAVDFFHRYLKHVEGRQFSGSPLQLQPWQEDLVRTLFGWKRQDGIQVSEGLLRNRKVWKRCTRRYRTCYVEVPRKNGKSTLAAGIALYLLICDGEPGVQVYGAAKDRDQATIVFRTASAMVQKSPQLSRRIRVLSSQKQMLLPDEPNSFYKVIAADAAGSHGFNPHGIVFDELHTQPNRDLWDVLESGKGARAQPLTFAISTAGHDRLSICWEQHEYARSVRDGLYDPSFLPVLYGAPDDADWMDEGVWRAANPNLGVSVSLEFLRDELRKAQENPAEENKFRNLYLNQWTQQLTRYIPMHLWDQAGCRKQLEPPKYAPCYGGLDLAKTQDLTAWVLVFPKGKKFVVKARFWIPEETAIQRERQHGRPYRLWAKQGLITLVPGRVMDYRMVRRQIVRDAERYDMQQMAYDPWNATETATILREEDGIDALEFRQSIVNLNEPTRMLLELVREERLIHGGHEVLRWNADCLEVKTDASGNVRPVKPDHATPARIDGMVALIMALGLAVRQPDTSTGGIFAL
jgi:phage terminase large subunit-like protein